MSGSKWAKECLKNHADMLTQVLVREDMSLPIHLPSWIESYVLTPKLFKMLDCYGSGQPLWVGKVPDMPEVDLKLVAEGPRAFLALSDPLNLGLALRSLAAFGWKEVVLLKECAFPWSGKVIRASAGSLFQLHFKEGPSIQDLGDLGENSFEFTFLDMEGVSLQEHTFDKNAQLLLGQEGLGLSKSSLPRGKGVHIPLAEGVDSLNSAVALSLALYEYQRQQD